MIKPHPYRSEAVDIGGADVVLINNADLRETSNRTCWPVAEAFERDLTEVLRTRFGKA